MTFGGEHARHWRLHETDDLVSGKVIRLFALDLRTLVSDVRLGVLGEDGYLAHLLATPDLQKLYFQFEDEILSY